MKGEVVVWVYAKKTTHHHLLECERHPGST